MEQKIIEYLKGKYAPKAVILVGSRAADEETPSSDWDLVLYTETEHESESEYFEDQFLDIEIIKLPVSEDHILQTSFAPDARMKILFDTPDGFAKKVVEKTLERYRQGPDPLSSEERERRRNKLHRFIDKIASRADDEGYVFNYIGAIYEFGIRYWFELRQEWSQPIYKALPYIKEHDLETYRLLEIMHGTTPPQEKVAAARAFYEGLFKVTN